jgi:26S proteasome regulatory subunit N7
VFLDRLIDEGGDWDRRNRLKVYRGIYCMSIREFKEAATLFLDTIATFTSYELMDYPKFVTYTVLCSVIALERPKLREKVPSHFFCLITGKTIGKLLFMWPQLREKVPSFSSLSFDPHVGRVYNHTSMFRGIFFGGKKLFEE